MAKQNSHLHEEITFHNTHLLSLSSSFVVVSNGRHWLLWPLWTLCAHTFTSSSVLHHYKATSTAINPCLEAAAWIFVHVHFYFQLHTVWRNNKNSKSNLAPEHMHYASGRATQGRHAAKWLDWLVKVQLLLTWFVHFLLLFVFVLVFFPSFQFFTDGKVNYWIIKLFLFVPNSFPV